jgi:hypothetical protein
VESPVCKPTVKTAQGIPGLQNGDLRDDSRGFATGDLLGAVKMDGSADFGPQSFDSSGYQVGYQGQYSKTKMSAVPDFAGHLGLVGMRQTGVSSLQIDLCIIRSSCNLLSDHSVHK